MAADFTPPPFGFCIDTSEYAGNFERELCAYVTGMVGECGVGVKESEIAHAQLKAEEISLFEDAVTSVPDDHGCYRPVSIWPTPGFFNDGHGDHYSDDEWEAKHESAFEGKKWPAYQSVCIFFSKKPTPETLALMESRAKEYLSEERTNLLGFRLLEFSFQETQLYSRKASPK